MTVGSGKRRLLPDEYLRHPDPYLREVPLQSGTMVGGGELGSMCFSFLAYRTTTLVACRPLGPCSTANSTRCPSSKFL